MTCMQRKASMHAAFAAYPAVPPMGGPLAPVAPADWPPPLVRTPLPLLPLPPGEVPEEPGGEAIVAPLAPLPLPPPQLPLCTGAVIRMPCPLMGATCKLVAGPGSVSCTHGVAAGILGVLQH